LLRDDLLRERAIGLPAGHGHSGGGGRRNRGGFDFYLTRLENPGFSYNFGLLFIM
jgi:hypothetical protein